MLEPPASANRLATTAGGSGRPVAGRGAAGGPPATDGVTFASAHRVADSAALAADRGGDSARWSHDWLQISHELRTPLNAILGNIELLLDGTVAPLAAPARACIGDIQVASRQLLDRLQPLLLLVQARTCGALATRTPIDLLALIRQADAACQPDPGAPEAASARHGPASLPEAIRLMVPGDPIWLGALAGALVDLHAASPAAGGPLSITLEPPEPGARGVVLRAFWRGLDATGTSPLPLALIDAVLALHEGRIESLASDGLRLRLPLAALATP